MPDQRLRARYKGWYLESTQTAECPHCDGRVNWAEASDSPDWESDITAMLTAIDNHVCDMGPRKGKRVGDDDAGGRSPE